MKSFQYFYVMNFRLPNCLLLLFFFSITVIAQKNQPAEKTREVCQKLIEEALTEEKKSNYNEALERLLKAELVAEENQWIDELAHIKHYIGRLYYRMSNYGDALQYSQESYSLMLESKELQSKVNLPLSNIALLYYREEKYSEAIHYLEKAYHSIPETEDKLIDKKRISTNTAIIYNKLNRPKESFKVLQRVHKPTNIETDFLWESAYTHALFLDGQVDTAISRAERLYEKYTKETDQNKICYSCLIWLLKEIHLGLNQKDRAIFYAKEGLRVDNELVSRIEFYDNLSTLYLQKGEYKNALQYKDSVVITKDSLSDLISRNLFEANKVKFKIKEFEYELNSEKERKKNQTYIFIGVLVIAIITFFSIYKSMKNRVIKQKQKITISNLVIEKEKKDRLLTEKQLELKKHEVAEKNRELTAKALYLNKRNQLIEDIIYSLESNSEKYQDKEIKKYIRSIKNILTADNQKEDFMSHFEKVNPLFLKRLKDNHPELTSNDIRFLSYVYMNLNLKEIASIFNITYNACKKRKWKIQEKIGLETTDSLYDYLFSV
ncbi:MAG: tetratricopeptide repeat protein [Moheibacter sp.]